MNSSLLFTKTDTCGNSDRFACKYINFSSTRKKIVVTILHKRQKSPISSGEGTFRKSNLPWLPGSLEFIV